MAGTLVIRADASGSVGTGHVMRCLALAQAWQGHGGRTIWIGHCPIEALRRRIRAADAAFEPLEHPHPHPADVAATRASLSRIARESDTFEIVWLVLDGMHFDPAYQDAVRPAEGRMLLIDDLAAWPQYHADLLLNQNLGAERKQYLCDEHASLLLGPRYALLRREFFRRRAGGGNRSSWEKAGRRGSWSRWEGPMLRTPRRWFSRVSSGWTCPGKPA